MKRVRPGVNGRLEGWLRSEGRVLRSAPFGVLVLAGLLALLGAGLVAAAALLLVTDPGVGWTALVGAVAAGPLLVYFASQLVRRRRWSWLAAVLLLLLLTASSAARVLLVGGEPVAPAAEIVVELLFLVYLLRPRLRRRFGWAA